MATVGSSSSGSSLTAQEVEDVSLVLVDADVCSSLTAQEVEDVLQWASVVLPRRLLDQTDLLLLCH